ncbi:CDP-alcohol phosphatidyltransferase family protein [Clostridium botulinum]|uniref:CDP-alcohol phosphatidyltransferase family protein n=1 Tax=Clostridium botulinum TaxID=1491 RepID=UPI001FA6B455|nr:CDP-alcohol phosphatidyltransferase family protein [Clostridium botulinum]
MARKTGTTSSLGAKIDSIADMIMACVLLFLIYTIVNLTSKIVIRIILISIIRLASMFIAMKKYKAFASVHTYGNKNRLMNNCKILHLKSYKVLMPYSFFYISFTTFNIIYFTPDARRLLLPLSRFDILRYHNLEYGCSNI